MHVNDPFDDIAKAMMEKKVKVTQTPFFENFSESETQEEERAEFKAKVQGLVASLVTMTGEVQ